ETTGLDPHTCKIRLIQIGCEGQPVLLVDCFKVNPEPVKEILSDVSIKKCLQNAKFDLKFLRTHLLPVRGKLFDTMIAAQLINSGVKEKCSLDALSKKYLGIDLSKENQKSNWSNDPLTQEQIEYAAMDAEILLPLRLKLCEKLYEMCLLKTAEIEFNCLYPVAEMELSGIKLDIEKWNILKAEYQEKKESLSKEILSLIHGKTSEENLDMFGENAVNLDSPAQLKEQLNKIGFPVSDTSFETLARLQNIPLIAKILDYRSVSKALSSFLVPLPEQIHKKTKRIHSTYWQTGSDAGRFSCSDPNLQQIPRTKDFRSCFIPHGGNKFVIADYSQIELRVAAEISGDETMVEAYSGGADLHRLTAQMVSGREEVTKEERQLAKALNFGLIFGMGAARFVEYARNSYGVTMTLDQAEEFKAKFFNGYKGLKKWHNKTKREKPMETRTLSGRRRVFSENEEYFQLTARLNTPVQGTAADICKMALGLLYEAIKPVGARIVGTVHDEILVEVKEEKAEETKQILSDCMVRAGQEFLKSVPVLADANVCNNWSDK
ncbi:MAG TPA: bifunctional 3'-5' exonuclease/DNA polymerase, partial [Atribacterota bacterium]|nr:bifunctional 3'-5' exonuclease/DNA polymerase [Atribacterota bacterium]